MPEDSPNRASESDIFLYNQNPTLGKGIACMAVIIVNSNGDAVEYVDEYEPIVHHQSSEPLSLDELKLMTEVTEVIPGAEIGWYPNEGAV